MFNFLILQQYFLGKVGFAQTQNPCYPKIHPTLLSTQGITVQGVQSSLLANEVIYDSIDSLLAAPDILAKIPLWDNTTPYAVGERVQYTTGGNTFVYVALQANTGNAPQWNSQFWETNLSDYLRTQHQYAVSECLAKTVVENNVEKSLRSVWSFHTTFQRNTGSVVSNYQNTDFVGVAIKLANFQNLVLCINEIGLEVEQAQTIPFYVFAQSNTNPIASFEVQILPTDVNKFVWKQTIDTVTNEPINLPFWASANDTGGFYYVGFFKDDVVGQVAIWDEAPTRLPYCSGSYVRSFNTTFDNKPNLPNVGYYGWETTNSFYSAFNLKVATKLDYTVNVQQTAQQFYKAIQYEIACKLLMEGSSSGRVNRANEVLKSRMGQALKGYDVNRNGYVSTKGGLLDTLETLKEQLKINLNYAGGSPFFNNFG